MWRSFAMILAAIMVSATAIVSLAFGQQANDDDNQKRQELAGIFFNCMANIDDGVLEKGTKPQQFEKNAKLKCKKIETGLREYLALEMLQVQVRAKQSINDSTQKVVAELIDKTVVGIRRSVVILYASVFDKRYPGVRSCTVTESSELDQTVQYLCALQN